MIWKTLALVVLLAAVTAVGALVVGPSLRIEPPAALHEGGIGPLIVDRDFRTAVRQAFRSAPESAFSGTGCAGLDEIRYDSQVDSWPVSIMAMADNGRIREVEATLYSPTQAENRQACLSLRNDFASAFIERFGPFVQTWEVSKPVSQELFARTGPVVVAARWFAMGGSCYISAHYGVLEGGSVRLGASLAAVDSDV